MGSEIKVEHELKSRKLRKKKKILKMFVIEHHWIPGVQIPVILILALSLQPHPQISGI